MKGKFCLIIEIDDDHHTLYADSKAKLKKLCRDFVNGKDCFEIYSPEYWKNNQEEYVDCSCGNNSMIQFSEWFENLQYKLQQETQ